MPPQGLRILFGTPWFGNSAVEGDFGNDAGILEAFDLLQKHGITSLDTAQMYMKSEATLGRLSAGTTAGFSIDTKWLGGWTGQAWASRENIVRSANESLSKLGVQQLDVFYIHGPDTKTPIEETLKGVDQVYRAGGFKRFGLSNYTPDQVREVLKVAKKHGYVKPTVYQGNYNAVARMAENELIPLLRENSIAFVAYSPIAGGFLAKDRKFVEEQRGRFNAKSINGIYQKLYTKPCFLDALDEWEKIANDEGISKASLAYRWVYFHSSLKPQYGDGIIVGATKLEQLERTLHALDTGPLSNITARRVDELWERVKGDSIIDNFQANFTEV